MNQNAVHQNQMDFMSDWYMPSSHLNLPPITLTARQGYLVGLDWFQEKSTRYFGALNFINQPNGNKSNGSQLNIYRHQYELNIQLLNQTKKQLSEYFSGQRQAFDLPLDLSIGTAFQQKVWQALLQINHSNILSYAQLAKQIGHPTSYRACANANGKNPISLIVPCHRVIASDGSLGGYTGGVSIKQKLLQIEGVRMFF